VTKRKPHMTSLHNAFFASVTFPTGFFLFFPLRSPPNLTFLSRSTSSLPAAACLPAYLELSESKRKYEVSKYDACSVNFGDSAMILYAAQAWPMRGTVLEYAKPLTKPYSCLPTACVATAAAAGNRTAGIGRLTDR